MSDQESEQDKLRKQREVDLEWMRSQFKGKRPSNEESYEYVKDKPPYRLELFYEADQNMIVLRGNAEGFRSLGLIIAQLADADRSIGSYFLFDEYTSLTKTNTQIMIKRVADVD
jgi:hypothetical protein